MNYKFPLDNITISNMTYKWNAPIPSNISVSSNDGTEFPLRRGATYTIDVETGQCQLVSSTFELTEAKWLTGNYTARNKHRCIEMIFNNGILIRSRMRTHLMDLLESTLMKQSDEIPEYSFWLAKALCDALSASQLHSPEQVIAAYGLKPKDYASIEELLHRPLSQHARETALRLNRSQRSPVALLSEPTYYAWVTKKVDDSGCIIGLKCSSKLRWLPRKIFSLIIRIASRTLVWKPIIHHDGKSLKILVGGVSFSQEFHMAYICK